MSSKPLETYFHGDSKSCQADNIDITLPINLQINRHDKIQPAVLCVHFLASTCDTGKEPEPCQNSLSLQNPMKTYESMHL